MSEMKDLESKYNDAFLADLLSQVTAPTTTPPAMPQCNCPCTYPSYWISVQRTVIGSSTLREATTNAYVIPDIIPSSAREVLVFVGANIGYSNIGPYSDLKIFTQIGTTQYEKYLRLYSYNQVAYNSNSENMWFPMPPNRKVYLTVPKPYGESVVIGFYVIGYR